MSFSHGLTLVRQNRVYIEEAMPTPQGDHQLTLQSHLIYTLQYLLPLHLLCHHAQTTRVRLLESHRVRTSSLYFPRSLVERCSSLHAVYLPYSCISTTTSEENKLVHDPQTQDKTLIPTARTATHRCNFGKSEGQHASTCKVKHKADVDLKYRIMPATNILKIYLHLEDGPKE